MQGFLKIAGDLSRWNIYRKAACVSDVTEMFIRRAFPQNTRTIDHMRQAARSCKQNIVEGVSDTTVSMEMGIKLVGVARGSLRELMEDYLDFLFQNDLKVWRLEDQVTRRARHFCKKRAYGQVQNRNLIDTYKKYPIHLEPGRKWYVLIGILNDRAMAERRCNQSIL